MATQTNAQAVHVLRNVPQPATITTPQSLRGYLLENRLVPREVLTRFSRVFRRDPTGFADALIRAGHLSGQELAQAQAVRCQLPVVDLQDQPPDPTLFSHMDPASAAQTGTLPWRIQDGAVVILCHCEQRFEETKADLEAIFGRVILAFACPQAIQTSVQHLGATALKDRAEAQVSDQDSCRTLNYTLIRAGFAGICALILIGFIAAPLFSITLLTAVAVLALVCGTGLKVAALVKRLGTSSRPDAQSPTDLPLPIVTILVPLYKEREIAGHLVTRLQRINYPRELLDILLVMEADDACTAQTIAATTLPPWIRVLRVPDGQIKTKPRALNFALNFAKGSIVGVYDAEDAPEPDQLIKVVHHFAKADPSVVCLQGILDYYNARENWLSRCFAVEYATWFRLVLPALQAMRMPVPLGGTTLFFRRQALSDLGGWDAHNVTEDADLGVRLARRGYRTEMVNTVTFEEANNRFWPWVKQRSRWLKGFAITWIVHMRSPRRLVQDLGWRGFIGIQLIFAVAILQFCLAPLLWTFWLVALGVYHPITTTLPQAAIMAFGSLFLMSEVISITAGMFAVTHTNHRHLIRWVPTMHVYFPLGALACYKALAELVVAPFYWDKTTHGKSAPPIDLGPELKPNVSAGSQTLRLDEHAQLHRQLLDRLEKSP